MLEGLHRSAWWEMARRKGVRVPQVVVEGWSSRELVLVLHWAASCPGTPMPEPVDRWWRSRRHASSVHP